MSLKKPILHGVLLTMLALGMQSVHAQQPSFLQNIVGKIFSDTKEEELLEPDKAFTMRTELQAPNTLRVVLTPAKGYYLYRERMRFALKDAKGVAIESVKLPPGELKDDPTFGTTETYKHPVLAEITLARAPKAGDFTLLARYQGCHEKLGVCYPPIDKEVRLSLP